MTDQNTTPSTTTDDTPVVPVVDEATPVVAEDTTPATPTPEVPTAEGETPAPEAVA